VYRRRERSATIFVQVAIIMAWSTVTATLVDNSTVTHTLPTTDFASATAAVQAIVRTHGFWDDTTTSFYPLDQVKKLVIS
jgi:hypothetical protein